LTREAREEPGGSPVAGGAGVLLGSRVLLAEHDAAARFSMVKGPAGSWTGFSQRKSQVGMLEAR
jgi:hypothetical protein